MKNVFFKGKSARIRTKLVILFVFFLQYFLYGNQKLDSLAMADPRKMIEISDQELRNAKDDEARVLVLINTALAYNMVREDNKMFNLLSELEDKYKSVGSLSFQFQTKLRIIKLYSNIKMFRRAKRDLRELLKKIEGFRDPNERSFYRGRVYYITGIVECDLFDFSSSISYLEKALSEFQAISDQSSFVEKKRFNILCIFQDMGHVYLTKGDAESAKTALLKVVQMGEKKPDIVYYVACTNLAEAYNRLGDSENAVEYLLKGQKEVEKMHDVYYLEETYKIALRIYQKNGDEANAELYRDRLKELETKLIQEEEKTLATSDPDFRGDRKLISNFNTALLYLTPFAIFVFAIFVYYMNRRSLLLKTKLATMENNMVDKMDSYFQLAEEEEKTTYRKGYTISEEMETELLKKLKKFEESDRFTSKNISLAVLASIMDTNPQYISELINKNRGVNFNVYINELRIYYIMNQIIENQEYNTYKIAHLAELCGFSSHSVFTKAFKQVLGILPSEFIEMSTKEKKEFQQHFKTDENT